MSDTATTALFRAILDEVRDTASARGTGTRTHTASKMLEAANRGGAMRQGLREVGGEALSVAPTMWR